MTSTAHSLVGGAIAASISNPAIALPLAVSSHFLMDALPHWDFGRGWKVKSKLRFLSEAALDGTFGLITTFLIFPGVDPIYLFCMIIAANLPDLLQIPYWFWEIKLPPFSWAYQIQHKISGHATLAVGVIIQVLTVGLIMLLLQKVQI